LGINHRLDRFVGSRGFLQTTLRAQGNAVYTCESHGFFLVIRSSTGHLKATFAAACPVGSRIEQVVVALTDEQVGIYALKVMLFWLGLMFSCDVFIKLGNTLFDFPEYSNSFY
jgi:hypothetical protein